LKSVALRAYEGLEEYPHQFRITRARTDAHARTRVGGCRGLDALVIGVLTDGAVGGF
jgi:hypothetical protein